jgi:ElaB/YqjD/DUF883 family membrane-anchored ribosome-binding protein
MTSDDTLKELQEALEKALPELEDFAKKAKNPPARKRLQERLERLRTALEAAKQA